MILVVYIALSKRYTGLSKAGLELRILGIIVGSFCVYASKFKNKINFSRYPKNQKYHKYCFLTIFIVFPV